jgi:transposase InsO family protein
MSMPWKETCAMEERKRFVLDWFSGSYTKTQLCEAYGISRPSGDKWIARALAEGVDGLAERSRAAHGHPNATAQELVDMIVSTKLARQHLGPKKIVDLLRAQHPKRQWPADSTAGEILKRAGLVRARRVRRRVCPDTKAFTNCEGCNDLWSIDFKGDFVLGNRQRCYPLTLTDNYSRYLLQCQALAHPNTRQVKPWMQWAFREYGLPHTIRSDNGAPFASLAVGGISELSKWWIKLGIQPQRNKPGKPGQNGRHERMHRSLKDATVCPPQPTMAAQQRRFDAFKHEFNCERSLRRSTALRPVLFIEPRAEPIQQNCLALNIRTM